MKKLFFSAGLILVLTLVSNAAVMSIESNEPLVTITIEGDDYIICEKIGKNTYCGVGATLDAAKKALEDAKNIK